MRQLVALLVMALAGNAWSQVLFSDSFDGAVLDSSKWSTIFPFSGAELSVQGGFLRSNGRGTIVTKAGLNSPYTVKGSFSNANDFSVFEVWLRSDGITIPTSGEGWVGGIGISFWGGPNFWSSPGVKVGLSDYSPNIFTDSTGFNPNQTYEFIITDFGNRITLDVDGVRRFDVSTSFSTGNKIAFNSRQNLSGQLGQTDVFQIEIVPEPSTFSLLLSGGALLMARRRRG